jgi:hypothetical protein
MTKINVACQDVSKHIHTRILTYIRTHMNEEDSYQSAAFTCAYAREQHLILLHASPTNF